MIESGFLLRRDHLNRAAYFSKVWPRAVRLELPSKGDASNGRIIRIILKAEPESMIVVKIPACNVPLCFLKNNQKASPCSKTNSEVRLSETVEL